MDILNLVIQAGAFISAFAAIAAGIIMARATKHFGNAGILASGLRTVSIGVFFIAAGIVIDGVQVYFSPTNTEAFSIFMILKAICFVSGTYIIVIGSKRTADKLENLAK
jgi:hypothetical protein